MRKPDPCKDIHFLAFLYLTFAHESDGNLDEDERSVIRSKLHEWCPEGTDLSQVDQYMDEAIDWYNDVDSDGRIDVMVDTASTLKDVYTEGARRALLSDLVSIAKADGNYDEVEKKWVDILAECMGLGSGGSRNIAVD